MAFQKLYVGGRFSKDIFLTVSGNGIVALSAEASKGLTEYDYDIYEDEETKQLKFQVNPDGEVQFRKVNQKYDHRYIFSRSYLAKYLKDKYGFKGSVKMKGEKVEDGFIFDLTTAIPVYSNRAVTK